MEIIEKIKQKFADIQAEFKKTQQSFGSVMTVDGNEIQFEGDVIAQGSAVTMPDGTPVPDGQYDLETGVQIVVSGGMVESLTDPGQAAPAQTNNESQYATVEQFDEAVNTMTQRFESLELKITEFEKAVNSLIELAGQQVEAINEFAKQTPEPVQKPEPSYVEKQKMAQQENLKSLAQTFTKLKNKK